MILAAILMGVFAAMQTFQQAEAQRRQQKYQADVARNNALAKEQQAEIVAARTEAEREAADVEKNKLSHKYRASAGENMSILAASNLAVGTGSAMDLFEGNLNRYADDMGELEYAKELKSWAGRRESQVLDWEADSLRENASFLDATAGSLGQSLLTAGLSGASTGMGTYAVAGGFKSGGAAAPKGLVQ